ncbi:uncharacterized protein F4812DRAFT_468119 [Daldinia caldariorum]|uniref:uncharacterized protein n=1 Tax=Daldinia caldariorum TaxID=326644 RepID=UPI002007EBA1|nr:uncharacterized protein F4812DRAFT_468119 [Daldinia caldariorum]KAI1464172.1 hypothetical protein F4812DRAFT_468119 [Daldinia caldariorum]
MSSSANLSVRQNMPSNTNPSEVRDPELINIDTVTAMLEDVQDRVRRYHSRDRHARSAEDGGSDTIKLLASSIDYVRTSLEAQSMMLEGIRVQIQSKDLDVMRPRIGGVNEHLEAVKEHVYQALQRVFLIRLDIERLKMEHTQLVQGSHKKTIANPSRHSQASSDESEDDSEEEPEEEATNPVNYKMLLIRAACAIAALGLLYLAYYDVIFYEQV